MKPGTLAALEEVLACCGWDEKGGRLLRDATTGEVIGRTTWVARAAFWHGRPEGLTEKRAHAVVAAALAGRRLGCRERRYLSWLVLTAEELAGNGAGRGGASGDTSAFDPADFETGEPAEGERDVSG